jgi:hypothetical protein
MYFINMVIFGEIQKKNTYDIIFNRLIQYEKSQNFAYRGYRSYSYDKRDCGKLRPYIPGYSATY